jgi:hypothetical protein
MQAILRHVNFDLVKCVILASPGFVKDQFMDYMIQQAVKSDNKIILDNKSKFLLVHASSGFKHSLKGSVYLYLYKISVSIMLTKYICFVFTVILFNLLLSQRF